jgi:hypothetical protein
LQETTKDSKKKVYGPYKGSFIKDKIKVKMAGGRQEQQIPHSQQQNAHSQYNRQPQPQPQPQQHTINNPPNEARTIIIRNYDEDIYNRALAKLIQRFPNFAGNTNTFIRILGLIAENIRVENADRAARVARIARAAKNSNAIGAARAANAARIANAAFDDRTARAAKGSQNNNVFNRNTITQALDLSHPRRGNPRRVNSENDDSIVFINPNPNPN